MLEYNAAVSQHAQEWADHLKNNNGGAMKHATWDQLSELDEGENLAIIYDPRRPLDKVAECKRANANW